MMPFINPSEHLVDIRNAERKTAKALNPNPSARIEKFGSLFAPGDKIMQTENDYDRDVFNGRSSDRAAHR
jgi:ATP-dependent exoDNAse (exonuclease V) alpha subunit